MITFNGTDHLVMVHMVHMITTATPMYCNDYERIFLYLLLLFTLFFFNFKLNFPRCSGGTGKVQEAFDQLLR